MRALILVAGAALTVSACGKTDSPTDDMNAMTADNVVIDGNEMVANDMGGMDNNMATNGAAEANMMMNDITNNDADTNLANGI